MASIMKKAKNYKRIPFQIIGQKQHELDPYTVPPKILKPPKDYYKANEDPDDITSFPKQQTVPLPEAIPYREGKYRPASIPINNGYYPYNVYLERGKIYWWCSCGISSQNPWCDQYCNRLSTRNRPVYFNVSESGYYKMCNCKMSSNAPFCNGTHRSVVKYHLTSYRGFTEIASTWVYLASWAYMLWNFYTQLIIVLLGFFKFYTNYNYSFFKYHFCYKYKRIIQSCFFLLVVGSICDLLSYLQLVKFYCYQL